MISIITAGNMIMVGTLIPSNDPIRSKSTCVVYFKNSSHDIYSADSLNIICVSLSSTSP